MPDRTKVYVTGLGAVCCLGGSVPDFWQALLAGACGLRPIDRFDPEGSPYTFGGQAVGLDSDEHVEAGASMGARFAARAAQQAVEGLPIKAREGLAVVLGTNFGPSEVIESLMDGEQEAVQRCLSGGLFAADADHVAARTGAGGERVILSLSCASGNAALAHAMTLVRCGRAEAVLAGGYDSMQKVVWAGLSCMRVMAVGSEDQPPRLRPFDRDRSGTIFSEGAGVLLLESAPHAEARGAQPLAELAGAGCNNNAYHMTHADHEGTATAEAIEMALRDAAIAPADVGHINAHGTGTKLNDAIETTALDRVFGPRAGGIPVTSVKGGLGHAMGAASALEAVACVLSLQDGVIPPTINLQNPDPACDLDVVAGGPRAADLAAVVNNSAGIGGCNAAVVLRKVR